MDHDVCMSCGKSLVDGREDPYCSYECQMIEHWHGHHSALTCFYLLNDFLFDTETDSDRPDYRNYCLFDPRESEIAAAYHISKVCDVYALACKIYEIYTGEPPARKTHMNIVTLIRAMINRKWTPHYHPIWTLEERTVWWLVDRCWKASPRSKPEVNLIEIILKDIGLFPHLSPPLHISAFKEAPSLDSTDDPGTAQTTQGLRWVLDKDDLRSRHLAMFGSKIMFPEDKSDPLIEANERILDLLRQAAAYWTITPAPVHSDNIAEDPPATLEDSDPGLPRISLTSDRTSISISDRSRQSYDMVDLQDPTLHFNWRSRITRLGDRSLDLQYGSLSYLVSARRKFMSGSSTTFGSTLEAWRSDNITVSDT